MDHAHLARERARTAEVIRATTDRIERCHAGAALDFELGAQSRHRIAESRRRLHEIDQRAREHYRQF